MFKLVVLSALLALAYAKPSLVVPAVHAAYVAPAIYAPAAVSHQSRVDYHSAPVHAAWAAPAHAAWAAPAHAAWAAPAHAAWAAPIHSAWAAPAHSAWAAPLALAPKTPAVVLGPHGVPLDTAAVVADRAYHYAVKANHHYLHKRSVLAAPIYVAPSAVSHTSRVDVHSTPVVAHYAAPVLSHYAAPLVSHYAAAPVVSHYAPWSSRSYWGKAAYGIHPW